MGRKWANIVAKKTAKDANNSRIYAKFGIEIYAANQVILIRMQTKNYVSSLIALKLIMYQNILLTEQSKKQKVQEMKHTLNCAMKDLDQAAQW